MASPLAGAAVGVAVSAGPSAGAEVTCLSTTAASRRCRTDADGQIVVRYRVRSSPANVLRATQDVLAVFHDPDQNGRRVPKAATSFVAHPVARTVSYVALGDSYSSGEQGRPGLHGFAGAYQAGVSPADAHCRRWDRAYPNIIADRVLGSADPNLEVTFSTHACTGATTRNIHDPRRPDGDVTQNDLIETNKPSRVVPSLRYDPGTGQLLTRPADWEPRQAASLAAAHAMTDVDMITITIGGNDAGFADIVRACVIALPGNLDSTCDEDDLALSWAAAQRRVTDVLRRIRAAAPRASVYALGYPPITPQPTPCPSGVSACPELGINSYIDTCPALSAAEIVRHTVDGDAVPFPLRLALGLVGIQAAEIADALGLALTASTPGFTKIDHVEADFLWSSAAALNSAVRNAAAAAGVHFVDSGMTGGPMDPAAGFAGRDPCGADPWLHGFVLDPDNTPAASARSFHPTRAGHEGYAQLLEQYIRTRVAAGAELSEAGLPANPAPGQR